MKLISISNAFQFACQGAAPICLHGSPRVGEQIPLNLTVAFIADQGLAKGLSFKTKQKHDIKNIFVMFFSLSKQKTNFFLFLQSIIAYGGWGDNPWKIMVNLKNPKKNTNQ